MIKILFINDEYLKKNFPIPARMDTKQLEGFIKASQLTHLTSFTGWCLYEYIEQKAIDQTLTAFEIKVYQIMQYLTGMYAYQLANDFLKSEVANTKHEESSSSRASIDDRIYAMESQITSIEARYRRELEADSTEANDLLDIAVGSGDCGYEYGDSYNDSVISFPYISNDSNECI